jgi:hypothetical protein
MIAWFSADILPAEVPAMPGACGDPKPRETSGTVRLEDDLNMIELTAAEVLALSALLEGRPMTSLELSHSVSDMGMHLNSDDAAATLRSLTEQGIAERTPAVSLGKYRITAQGRAWLASHTAPEESEARDNTR